ncbi:uncharacterized protein B0H18DRAFT_959314 [Fomitopsis serialis]|uniref:uncharacterized protein n=1 Tax=Fomitopsis serialis TaxID=139415 RepID=UPI00200803F7|nr:uncharacterized protein B0H18DRAFT_959314 [Neoantrodia serialis]KAH9915509.1 hypothetical protein B0H18DRAFT_959314 [Neoantrodia serialis]
MAFSILSMANDDDERKSIVFKGKSPLFWPHLPPEVVRLIATFHLLNVAPDAQCPETWQHPQMWPSRFVWSLIRDTYEVERLMRVYPSWGAAHAAFSAAWSIPLARCFSVVLRHPCVMIDPQDLLIHHSVIHPTSKGGSANAKPVRLSPYQHFRNIFGCSCIVCRINYPFTPNGLAVAKRAITNPWLGQVMACKDHRKSTFCEAEYAQGLSVCAVENEDDQTWPGVETTCRMCRKQGIWLAAKHDPLEREAVGGNPQLTADDWETRQAIEAFVDLGEGMIKDVLELAKEKHWFKVNTKLADMLSQALAASRFAGRGEGAEGYVSEEELSEEEEDAELVSITEDAAGIRELAITDFARNRILDGHWVNPTDEYNMRWVSTTANTPQAQHPCPWNAGSVFDGALEDGEAHADGGELAHPRPKTIAALRPPTYNISSMTYQAYVKQFRDIVFPAMQNVVQRLAAECAADGKDAVEVARGMSVDDVAVALRDEAVWRTGVDWLEWRANQQEHDRRRRREKDDDAESTSSRSSGSHMTSPGLSTTTLQTTPSPPPSSVKDDDAMSSSPVSAIPPALESSPILKSPQLMHPIPYVPAKVSHLPEYSIGTFRSSWANACAPLYQCYCSICQRRVMQMNAAANAAAVQDQTATSDVTPLCRFLRCKWRYGCCAAGGSPPKRARTDGSYSPSMVPMTPSPGRLRKRPSEELEEDSEAAQGNGEHKRSRTESHPRSVSASAEVVA